MNRVTPASYFMVVKLHPAYALVALFGVLGMSLWALMLSPAELDSGLGMLLFVQMFLASSGFVPRARRGHFDPVLVGESGMRTTAASHWAISVAPGIAAWLVLGVTGAIVGSPAAMSALAGRRAAGMFIVCAVSWSAGFLLPRGAAGMVWIGALLGLLLRHVQLLPTGADPLITTASLIRQAATVIACPFLLLGTATAVAPAAVSIAAALAAAGLFGVWRMANVVDFHLMDRT
jgi:hypothetical protein